LSDLSTTCVPWPGALTPAAARSGFLSTWDNWGYQVQPFAARAPLMILNGNHERDFPGSNDSFANPVFGPGTLTCPAIANTSSPYCITDSRGECGARRASCSLARCTTVCLCGAPEAAIRALGALVRSRPRGAHSWRAQRMVWLTTRT